MASSNYYLFTYNSTTTEPPTGSQLRLNAGFNYSTVTKIWVRTLTSDGFDVYYSLVTIPSTEIIYIQDKNDHTRVVKFVMAGAPIDKTTYVELPVAFQSTSGVTLANGQDVVLARVASTTSPEPPQPPIVLPPLITLDQAKLQLRIVTTDTSQDTDLSRLMDAAQTIVINYIAKSQAGRDLMANWTSPTTVQKDVQHAILYQLCELDANRGDQGANGAERDEHQDLSRVVIGLLRRVTDPVLA